MNHLLVLIRAPWEKIYQKLILIILSFMARLLCRLSIFSSTFLPTARERSPCVKIVLCKFLVSSKLKSFMVWFLCHPIATTIPKLIKLESTKKNGRKEQLLCNICVHEYLSFVEQLISFFHFILIPSYGTTNHLSGTTHRWHQFFDATFQVPGTHGTFAKDWCTLDIEIFINNHWCNHSWSTYYILCILIIPIHWICINKTIDHQLTPITRPLEPRWNFVSIFYNKAKFATFWISKHPQYQYEPYDITIICNGIR